MNLNAFHGVTLTRHTRRIRIVPPFAPSAFRATLATVVTPGTCVDSGAATASPPAKLAAPPMTLSDSIWIYVG